MVVGGLPGEGWGWVPGQRGPPSKPSPGAPPAGWEPRRPHCSPTSWPPSPDSAPHQHPSRWQPSGPLPAP